MFRKSDLEIKLADLKLETAYLKRANEQKQGELLDLLIAEARATKTAKKKTR